LTARKLAVGVGATWQFAGTPPSLAASTHVRDSGEALNDHNILLKWGLKPYYDRAARSLGVSLPLSWLTRRMRPSENQGIKSLSAEKKNWFVWMTWFRNRTSRAGINCCSLPLTQHKQQIQQMKTEFRNRSHDAVIRVYDEAGNVIETHDQAGNFKEF
jgi:YD repeat-containing protein